MTIKFKKEKFREIDFTKKNFLSCLFYTLQSFNDEKTQNSRILTIQELSSFNIRNNEEKNI